MFISFKITPGYSDSKLHKILIRRWREDMVDRETELWNSNKLNTFEPYKANKP